MQETSNVAGNKEWADASRSLTISAYVDAGPLRLVEPTATIRKRGYEEEVESTGRFSAEVAGLWEAGRAKATPKRRSSGARRSRLA